MKPITPQEAKSKKSATIPSEVVNAFNQLITERLRGKSATFTQNEVVYKILENMDVARNDIFDNGWLDIEPLFEKAGWKVEYDKPGFNVIKKPKRNETYDAKFIFEVK